MLTVLKLPVVRYGLAAFALLALLGGLYACGHSRGYDARQQDEIVEQAQARAAAEDRQTNEATRLDNVNADNRNQLTGVIENAVTNHPQEAGHPTGPATDAALRELRNRRSRP